MTLTFAKDGGRLLSRPGRGDRTAKALRERERLEKAFKPDARAWFLPLRWRLLASRPVITPERVTVDTVTVLRMRRVKDEHGKPVGHSAPVLIERTVRTVVPAIYGASTFRNRIEKGKHV